MTPTRRYFALITGITGALGNNLLGFVLPPLFYYKLRARAGYWAPVAALCGKKEKVKALSTMQEEQEAAAPSIASSTPHTAKRPDAQGGGGGDDGSAGGAVAGLEATVARRRVGLERLQELAGLVALGVFGLLFLFVSTSKFVNEILDRKSKGT